MALKKSELYSSLWASCDELRGGMDASQYKDYVLVLLFTKYVSDKYAGQPYAPITIPEGSSFKDMRDCATTLAWCTWWTRSPIRHRPRLRPIFACTAFRAAAMSIRTTSWNV